MITFEQFLNEDNKSNKFAEFAKDRLAGCEKVLALARSKGGNARLTVQHFEVKLPYYRSAASGNFNVDSSKREYRQLHARCANLTMQPRLFQETVGRLEVLGELILAYEKGV